MCTVTFIPTNTGFYFTSSRDERASRATIPPLNYMVNGIELIYPKDEIAGGTWIASNTTGRIACLLNGAFKNHIKKNNYNRSRGVVLLESFNYDNANDFYQKINLDNIEPFTLLLLENTIQNLTLDFFELRWDGEQKYFKQLEINKAQVWSSVTLYDDEAQIKRQQLFEQWLQNHLDYQDAQILSFHKRKHGLSTHEDILMQGKGDLKTVSISQIHSENNYSVFNYLDIDAEKKHTIKLTNNNLRHA